MADLKDGVKDGKQFPFRYEAAYNRLKDERGKVNHLSIILDGLEECIDAAVENLPKLKGVTVSLSDNSGSAWGALTSEYGSTKIAHIDNLSSVIAAQCSDEGYVVKFGDNYKEFPVSHRNGVLKQATEIDDHGYLDIGGHTEGGIWKWFKNAIENKVWVDNLFITVQDKMEYSKAYSYRMGQMSHWKYKSYGRAQRVDLEGMINVYKLILEYRKRVNPNVNVFSVQTAGYDNVVVPQMTYRCAMLTGWTGKEILFAHEYIKQWDDIEWKNTSPHVAPNN